MRKRILVGICIMILSSCGNRLNDGANVCSTMDDIAFMEYCYSHFDVDKDGKVSKREAEAVKEISISNKSIYSLKGLESFPSLISLYCDNNRISSIDVSKNNALETLVCHNNPISFIDLTKSLLFKHSEGACDNLVGFYPMNDELTILMTDNQYENLKEGLLVIPEFYKNYPYGDIYAFCDELTSFIFKNGIIVHNGSEYKLLTNNDSEYKGGMVMIIGNSMYLQVNPSELTDAIKALFNITICISSSK